MHKGTASVNVDGRMIDIAYVERSRRTLVRADDIKDMEKRKEEALRGTDSMEETLRAAFDNI
ncbi:MAG: hypothetical protein NWE88_02480 [Candidatus Bathyarchaeota archaeon]|nr:hypothetical protein [Candidatus Bathyarchaeota archaeon]